MVNNVKKDEANQLADANLLLSRKTLRYNQAQIRPQTV
jgi:hypothetical protein